MDLKRRLAAEFSADRDGYTEGKTEFIVREERIIEGYDAYTNNVRWRLIPFVW